MSKQLSKQNMGCPWCGCQLTEVCVTAVAWLECEKCGAQNGHHVEPEKDELWHRVNTPPQRVLDELNERWNTRAVNK